MQNHFARAARSHPISRGLSHIEFVVGVRQSLSFAQELRGGGITFLVIHHRLDTPGNNRSAKAKRLEQRSSHRIAVLKLRRTLAADRRHLAGDMVETGIEIRFVEWFRSPRNASTTGTLEGLLR